jgi:hypothetical protein
VEQKDALIALRSAKFACAILTSIAWMARTRRHVKMVRRSGTKDFVLGSSGLSRPFVLFLEREKLRGRESTTVENRKPDERGWD